MSIRSVSRAIVLGAVAVTTSLVPALASAPAQAASSVSQVGPGWTAITLSNSDYSGRATLILVGPQGQRIRVGTFPAYTAVQDISNDGRRVALSTPLKDSSMRFTVYDLQTRTSTSFVSTTVARVRFTNPTGLNLLASRMGAINALPTQRLALDGTVLATFKGSDDLPLPTLDGRYAISSHKDHITLSDNASGALVRTYANPVGYSFCNPIANVTSSTFTAWCASTSVAQVFRFSTSGTVTPVTSHLPATPIRLGYIDARQTPAGLVVAENPGCGAPPYGLYRNGKVRWFSYSVNSAAVVGYDGAGLIIAGNQECDGGADVLARYDIGTGRTTVTFRASAYTTKVGTTVVRKAIASMSVVDPLA